MAGEVCTGRAHYCFILSSILVYIFLPPSVSDEPRISCDDSNDGEYVRDTSDCAVVYKCSVADDGWLKLTCPENYLFDLNINTCNHNFMVQCSKECVTNPCIQNGICTEITGGYKCSYPNTEGGGSEGGGGGDGKRQILVSQHRKREILLFDPLTKEYTPISFVGSPNVMKYDATNSKLYVAFEDPYEIVVTDVKKSFTETLRQDVWSEGLALDVKSDLLFYTDYNDGTINSMTLTGDDHNVLVDSRLRYPRSVVADIDHRKLYWVDIIMDRIERADYNGNYRETFVSTSYPPRALDMIPGGDKLYWCDEQDEIWEVTVTRDSKTPPTLKNIYKPPTEDLLQCDSLAVDAAHIYVVYLLSENIYEWNTTGVQTNVYDGTNHLAYGVFKTVLPIHHTLPAFRK